MSVCVANLLQGLKIKLEHRKGGENWGPKSILSGPLWWILRETDLDLNPVRVQELPFISGQEDRRQEG